MEGNINALPDRIKTSLTLPLPPIYTRIPSSRWCLDCAEAPISNHGIPFERSDMLNSSNTYTSLVMDAPGVDPKQLGILVPLSLEAVVAAIHQAVQIPPPCVDEFAMCPDLVSDDGSSQRYVPSHRFLHANVLEPDSYPRSSISVPNSPQTYYNPSPLQIHIDCGSFYSPTTVAPSPKPSAARVLIQAPCAGGQPIKKKDGGFICSSCNKPFGRRDEAKRHIKSAGVQVSCRYCGKPASGRTDGKRRHLLGNKTCLKVWEAGYKTGRFTDRSVEDAYN
jgi:DNA-directed RNA polymerase subunit RPC12/RpoP